MNYKNAVPNPWIEKKRAIDKNRVSYPVTLEI